MRKTLPMLAILTALALGATGCLAHHQGPMPGEPPTASYLQVQGARVRYVDVGQGPAVVLLHGFASSLETWLLAMPLLQRRHRVIAMDLKGFGWTDRPEGDYSPAEQARIVRALLDARGVGEVAVVAHSWGCSIALQMALQHPDKVSRLVLFDAWAYDAQLPAFFRWAMVPGVGEALFAAFYQQRPEDRLAQAFHDPAVVDQKLADDVLFSLTRPGTTAAALAAVRGQDFRKTEARYRTIRQPTLLVWGAEDRVALPEYGERLSMELPAAELHVLPRVGHFPMLEAPARTHALMLPFLAGGDR